MIAKCKTCGQEIERYMVCGSGPSILVPIPHRCPNLPDTGSSET